MQKKSYLVVEVVSMLFHMILEKTMMHRVHNVILTSMTMRADTLLTLTSTMGMKKKKMFIPRASHDIVG